MEGCTFQPVRKPPSGLQKSATAVKIPGHDQFLKRQKEANRIKREKEQALQNIGRKKKTQSQTEIEKVDRKSETPLFDIELNIGEE
jgi:hypothetical protein